MKAFYNNTPNSLCHQGEQIKKLYLTLRIITTSSVPTVIRKSWDWERSLKSLKQRKEPTWLKTWPFLWQRWMTCLTSSSTVFTLREKVWDKNWLRWSLNPLKIRMDSQNRPSCWRPTWRLLRLEHQKRLNNSQKLRGRSWLSSSVLTQIY